MTDPQPQTRQDGERAPGFTWGTVEHLFSIYMGLVAGTISTAVLGVWAGVTLIVLNMLLTLWVTSHVPADGDQEPR